MSALLSTENLSRHFGGLHAVDGVSLSIEEGKVHSIIGPNGAGKSTFFSLISGRMPPTAGRIRFRGRDITGEPQHRVARMGISRSYQITTVFKQLSLFENVRLAVQSPLAFHFWRRADRYAAVNRKAEQILESVGLLQKGDTIAATLSHGEQRHLDIAIALAGEPQLLLLDEPTAGMSPVETEQTVALIRRLSQSLTVGLVEHKMDMIMSVSDVVTVLHFGQVLAEGTPAAIRANAAVQEAYLGGVV